MMNEDADNLCPLVRLLILRSANEMDTLHSKYKDNAESPPWVAIEKQLGHKIR